MAAQRKFTDKQIERIQNAIERARLKGKSIRAAVVELADRYQCHISTIYRIASDQR